jgi:hypothetical protein
MQLYYSSLITLGLAVFAVAFPNHASLAGLSDEELAYIIPTLQIRAVPPPPGPLNDTSPKLVNDPAHPWKPLKPNDIRGPCPGLNTLASHGASTTYQDIFHYVTNHRLLVDPTFWDSDAYSNN